MRLFRRGRLAAAPVDVLEDVGATSRRSFLRASGGYAAVAAVPTAAVLAAPAGATSARPANGVPTANPTGTPPTEPVMAYVHDAKAGTVVIMTGTTERTVKDRELVRRLTVATKKRKPKKRATRRRTTARRPSSTGRKG
ncbi:hypothetical protein [Patulibacter sp.]|uniref:hypothetical protein n=1 Tax=Patulibacter sp. TaxID=1912859 RepID=UPI002728D72D|nr:hypothetical protein [Patulibacter sp.]MDO9407833.1 hypothetical protein [Patulibacter sp.]